MKTWRSSIQIVVRQFYTTFAPAYDLLAWLASSGQWHAWQRTAFEPVAGRDCVLELGHGTGYVLRELARTAGTITGVDISPQMTRIARRRAPLASMARAASQALPFASKSFEAVISTFPTEYVLDRQTFSEVYRVLKPGGRYVIVLEAMITGRSLMDRLLHTFLRITGLAAKPEDVWGAPWSIPGFNIVHQQVDLPRAIVFRVVADKVE